MTKVVDGNDEIEVFLVDKGERKSVMVNDVRRLPKDFEKLPKIAIPCKLEGITPPKGATNFSGDYYLFVKKWANPGLFLFIFVLFLQFQYKLKKSVDGVLGIRTWGRWMVGADETTELWRPPYYLFVILPSLALALAKQIKQRFSKNINNKGKKWNLLNG